MIMKQALPVHLRQCPASMSRATAAMLKRSAAPSPLCGVSTEMNSISASSTCSARSSRPAKDNLP